MNCPVLYTVLFKFVIHGQWQGRNRALIGLTHFGPPFASHGQIRRRYEICNRSNIMVHAVGHVLAAGTGIDVFAASHLAPHPSIYDRRLYTRGSVQTHFSYLPLPLSANGHALSTHF